MQDGTQSARPLGVIAIEMMQNGVPPREGKLTLDREELWSDVANNFIRVADWGTLDDIQSVSCITLDLIRSKCLVQHRFLKGPPPSELIPRIHTSTWNTTEV